MSELAIIVGLGIGSFLFFYFASILDKDQWVLKLIIVFFGLASLILIPKALIDDVDYCQIVQSNETTTNFYANSTATRIENSTTDYSYERFCVTNSKTTTKTFNGLITLFWKVFGLYAFVFLIYLLFVKTNLLRFMQK